ncbi:DUF397 domain-containing protein [Streptomyces jumonjinensis]|uniref:DUF397 domain-containing protein n=1 Tax=Streptomyces jumonjinensis TaxID=1945 RepID=A0A646KQ90_STRJU|nr:DUF397 domain-containing protein [Streptomyces jumonjinensis]MQT04484.1 DUF397 domain-containing protein [Streptomyces jumonjinensis]
MSQVRPALRAADLPGASWRKASFSAGEGNCVEVADCTEFASRGIAIRDSKDSEGPVLLFQRATFSAFVSGIDVVDQ